MMEKYKNHELFSEIRPHILKKFWQFHAENPHIYDLVKKYAMEAKASRRNRFSIAMIWERMRWYVTIETNDEFFKLNNNHKACYARMLMIDDPSFQTFFSRKVTVKQREMFL